VVLTALTICSETKTSNSEKLYRPRIPHRRRCMAYLDRVTPVVDQTISRLASQLIQSLNAYFRHKLHDLEGIAQKFSADSTVRRWMI
jgi:hypothetical protein